MSAKRVLRSRHVRSVEPPPFRLFSPQQPHRWCVLYHREAQRMRQQPQMSILTQNAGNSASDSQPPSTHDIPAMRTISPVAIQDAQPGATAERHTCRASTCATSLRHIRVNRERAGATEILALTNRSYPLSSHRFQDSPRRRSQW